MGIAQLVLYSIGVATHTAALTSLIWLYFYVKAVQGYAIKGILAYILSAAIQFVLFLFFTYFHVCF